MVPVLAALSVCTLHVRTRAPLTCCHPHFTTFLTQASSHRFSTWLTCVRTHARALARGILTFTHVPRQPLELPRIGGPPLLALRICVRTHARVLARGILTLPHVRDNSSVSAAPSACTLHTRTCPPVTCFHSHLTTQFATKSRLFFRRCSTRLLSLGATHLTHRAQRKNWSCFASLAPPDPLTVPPHALANNFLMCL